LKKILLGERIGRFRGRTEIRKRVIPVRAQTERTTLGKG